MAIRWRLSATQKWLLPDQRPRAAPAASAAQWEETRDLKRAARFAIVPGAAASNALTSHPRTNSPAAGRIGKKPGTPPTRPPRRQNAQGSASQRAARSIKAKTPHNKPYNEKPPPPNTHHPHLP